MNPPTHSPLEMPSESTLRDAAKLSVLDADGNESCQDYVKAVSESIPAPSQLPTNTTIIIVGCGASSLIATYRDTTKCPFPIYTDPTRCLHALFDMKMTLDAGDNAPNYSTSSMFSLVIRGITTTLGRLLSGDMLQSGNKWQNGGELLFEAEFANGAEGGDEEIKVNVPFCHIMKNTRDHSEVSVLRTILGLDEEHS
ncbi:hypothetical protein RJZ90_005465 [Blastomyces dermatitidis]